MYVCQALKYDPFDDLDQNETFLVNSEALNEQVRHRAGLGHRDRQQQNPKVLSAAARRRQISERIAEMDDKARIKHLRELKMQGRFVDWDNVMASDFSWKQLSTGAISDNILRFRLNGQLLSLPSEANKRRWRMIPVDSVCRLRLVAADGTPTSAVCGTRNPTEMHVLSSCTAALAQGRYTWRHNSVLLVLKMALIPQLLAINSGNVRIPKQNEVRFRSEATGDWYNGGKSAPMLQPKRLRDWLALATDWQLQCDLKGDAFYYRNGVFPPEVASTGKRPDILLLSRLEKVALCIELTVPNEDNINNAHASKSARYKHLEDEAASNGWRLTTWPIEVGARGFVGRSTWDFLRALAFGKARCSSIKRQLELVTIRCSYYLFVSRGEADWTDLSLLAPAADRGDDHAHHQRGS